MGKSEQKNNPYILIDFTKVWKYIPGITRPRKEIIKGILFTSFPILFKRLAIYQNWKNSRVYAEKKISIITKKYWSKRLLNYYYLDIEKQNCDNSLNKNIKKIAIILHVFYLDVFEEIVELLKKNDKADFKLFITTPEGLIQEINSKLKSTSFDYSIMEVMNRGRDVLPFLTVLPRAFDEGFDTILKIHTKRSNHLKKNENWRDDLFGKLIGDGAINNAIQVFNSHKEIGILGPIGHILPMSFYYGANSGRVEMLSYKMGLKSNQLSDFLFVAGTMFFARKDALLPLLELGLIEHDFELEENQLDGTLAHAIERVFTSGLLVSGLKLADTSSTSENISCRIDFNYKFTL